MLFSRRLEGQARSSARVLAVLAFATLAAGAPAGCSTAKVNDAPDAKPQFECKGDPILFCNPAPAGAPGCVGFPDSADAFLKRLPANQAFAEGCVANFVERDVKLEDVCGLAAVCTCVRLPDDVPDAAPPPRDASPADASPDALPPVPDASADASLDPDGGASDASLADASEAGPPPPPDAGPPPPPDAGPPPPPKPARLAWSCR